jgi:glutaminyl-tRNA synthetase
VEEGTDFISNVNCNSLEVLSSCRVEPFLAGTVQGKRYQFERIGYFCVDPDTTPDNLVFNRTVSLRDEWANIQKQQK